MEFILSQYSTLLYKKPYILAGIVFKLLTNAADAAATTVADHNLKLRTGLTRSNRCFCKLYPKDEIQQLSILDIHTYLHTYIQQITYVQIIVT